MARILQITQNRCGGQWVHDVLNATEISIHSRALNSGVSIEADECTLANLDVPDNAIAGPIYSMMPSQWSAWRAPEDKALVVMRDPRDIGASLLTSYLRTHASQFDVTAELPESSLASAPLKTSTNYISEIVSAKAQWFRSWRSEMPNASFILMRYEDLILEPLASFQQIFEYFQWNVPKDSLMAVLKRLSAHCPLGADDGILGLEKPGDWRRYLSTETGAHFEAAMPGLISSIGYETSNDWWLSLPKVITQSTEIEHESLKKKNDFLKRENRELKQQIADKNNSINKLKQKLDGATVQKVTPVARKAKVTTRIMARLRGTSRVLVRRVRRVIGPRLGILHQYPPRPVFLSRLPESVHHKMPSISLITPSFEQGSFIEKTIRSVLDQNYPHLEYHIQDGGSEDQTVEVVQTFADALSFESKQDDGQSNALNIGFKRSSGEIMAYLNSDDLLLPGALALVGQYFLDHPDVDVVYGDRIIVNQDGLEIARWRLPEHDDDVLSWADYIPQETLFWRRSAWEKAGGEIDETFRFAMDWDLIIRLRDSGAKFAHIPQFLGAFRVHDNQKTSAVINTVGHEEMARLRLRALGFAPTDHQIHRAILPYLMSHTRVDVPARLRAMLWKGLRLDL